MLLPPIRGGLLNLQEFYQNSRTNRISVFHSKKRDDSNVASSVNYGVASNFICNCKTNVTIIRGLLENISSTQS